MSCWFSYVKPRRNEEYYGDVIVALTITINVCDYLLQSSINETEFYGITLDWFICKKYSICLRKIINLCKISYKRQSNCPVDGFRIRPILYSLVTEMKIIFIVEIVSLLNINIFKHFNVAFLNSEGQYIYLSHVVIQGTC